MVDKVTIPTGATGLSAAFKLGEKRIACIIMPGTWTAANLTFAVCEQVNGTFLPLHDDAGAEISVTAAASRAIGMDAVAMELSGMPFVKIRSGTLATPVDQAASRDLYVVMV